MAMNLPRSLVRTPLIKQVRKAFPGAEPHLCLCHHFPRLPAGSRQWASISPGYFSPHRRSWTRSHSADVC